MKIAIAAVASVLLSVSAAEAAWKNYFNTAVFEYVKKTCKNTDTCLLKFSKAPATLFIEHVSCRYELEPPNLGLRGARIINEVSNGVQHHELTPIFVGPQVIDSVDKENVAKFDKRYSSNDQMFMGYNKGDLPQIEVDIVKNEPGGFPDVTIECRAIGYYPKKK